MNRPILTALVCCLVGIGTCFSGDVVVLPVIVDSVPGMYDSLWDTQVRIVKTDLSSSVVVTRKWVCLANGGFVDDPATAPKWELPWQPDVQVPGYDSKVLTASELLAGAGSDRGAVALEIEGGEVEISASVFDVNLGGYNEDRPGLPFGFGQSYLAQRDPLLGRSHIPWIGGCYGSSDLQQSCDAHYRNNIGIVNPNPEPLEVQLWPIPYRFTQMGAEPLETIPILVVPAYGWLQTAVPLNNRYQDWSPYIDLWRFPQYGVLNIIPVQDLSFFAYASVVYTPLPDTTGAQFSDPFFQIAVPGYVMSYRDLDERKEGSR